MKYKIRKGEETKPAKERIIEKRGHVISFSLEQMESDLESNTKTRKEIEAKMNYEAAKSENIESFHPFVKDMSEEDQHTAWMYYESRRSHKLAQDKLKEFDEVMLEMAEEIAEIKNQLPELID